MQFIKLSRIKKKVEQFCRFYKTTSLTNRKLHIIIRVLCDHLPPTAYKIAFRNYIARHEISPVCYVCTSRRNRTPCREKSRATGRDIQVPANSFNVFRIIERIGYR